MHTPHQTPWFRQFWPWFLIALPSSVVIAAIITLMLAIKSPNPLVVDDYQKIGLSLQQSQARNAQAAHLGLSAELILDREQGTVRVEMFKLPPDTATLSLRFIHPLFAEHDFQLTLKSQDTSIFIGNSRTALAGRWYLELSPPDNSWRLSGELHATTQRLMLNTE